MVKKQTFRKSLNKTNTIKEKIMEKLGALNPREYKAIDLTLEEVKKEINFATSEPVSICRKCGIHWDGILDRCENCGSKNIESYFCLDDIEELKEELGIDG